MCMWQSQALGGALSLGGSVPAEYGTDWALPGRMEIPVVAAATTAMAAPLSMLRPALVWDSPCVRLSRRWLHYSLKVRPLYRLAGRGSHRCNQSAMRHCSGACNEMRAMRQPPIATQAWHFYRCGIEAGAAFIVNYIPTPTTYLFSGHLPPSVVDDRHAQKIT